MSRGRGSRRSLAMQLALLVRPWPGLLALVAACVVASALFKLVPPFVVRQVIDQDLLPGRTAGLLEGGLLYLGAVVADAAFTFGYSYWASAVARRALADLRVRVFSHLMQMPISYFDRTALGEAIGRATADVDTIDSLFTSGIITLIGQLVPLVAVSAAMVVLSPSLSLVAVLVAPPLIGVSWFLRARVRTAERQTRVAVSMLNSQIAEMVGGAETIQAFGRVQVFALRFRRALLTTLAAQNRSSLYSTFYVPITNLLSAAVIAALIWVGAGGPRAAVDLGTLTGFVLLFQQFFGPIVAVGDQWQSIQSALAGMERVMDVLELPVEPRPEASARGLTTTGIEIDRVSFGYRGDRRVLDGVTLRVAPGQHLAIVGRTGAGKSSLLALAGGLYAPWTGSVRICGADPRSLAESERRRVIGVVPQAGHLFAGTLRDNLTLYDTSLGDDAIERAAAITGLSGLADDLPEGYDTLLAGEGRGIGTVLSAGQRQLVALTRALVGEPSVLLLDEATADIDGSSDASFRAALRETALRRGCAVLTVAHRLSTAREADIVTVFDRGRVVELGPPAQLLAQGGPFSALVELEAAGWDWDDTAAR
jgi:ATP-binding cassette, subfamily B, multidrug efflux pump